MAAAATDRVAAGARQSTVSARPTAPSRERGTSIQCVHELDLFLRVFIYFTFALTGFEFFGKEVVFLDERLEQHPGPRTLDTGHRTRHSVMCVTLASRWALHSGREIQPAEQEQRPGGGVGVGCGVLARREGGAGVLPQKRCDWTGRRQNWPTMWQAPCLARCGSVRTGRPLAGEGEGRGADCPWHSDPFRVRARYGVGWGCAVGLRVRWGCADAMALTCLQQLFFFACVSPRTVLRFVRIEIYTYDTRT